MALSRLENFLKSSRGKILYVNPENLDSTDSITNDGSSPFVPFKTINRALMECARYSYQIGLSNDKFNFCTIVLSSGEYFVDNRPGLVINDDGSGFLRSGASATLSQFDLNTILDITDENNKLYLLNSVYGGVIVPRGTSIVAQDLRKTVIRPLYVPDPRNNNIERSAIFRTTGASFYYSFSIEDAKPNGFCYKNYNSAKFTPNFSHHKLTAFEYVDGVSDVKINDTFLNINTTRTDLEQYYEKISLVYGESSGRSIDDVNYVGGVSVDIQPIIDEYRIVGPRGDSIGITSIRSGDGVSASETITVTLDEPIDGISVDTSIQISDVNFSGYDGQFVVSSILSQNELQYITPEVPTVLNPPLFGATLNIISDTTSSASPYIFNVSLKSVYGMCGLHADGSKVEGFKSVVVAQFTAISLQKDDDAFVIYDETSGNYVDSTVISDLYKNTRSRYKPSYENYHIKVSNDSFAQLVSVFSIGYAAQIVAESGGDYSVTNSNSNFGAKTFISSGFKKESFDQDDHGYIVGVIPPEEISQKSISIQFPQIDVGLTTSVSAGSATTTRLYFYNEKNIDSPPLALSDGFRIGAKENDKIYTEYPSETSSRIVIPGTNNSYQKSFVVQRQNNNFENSITNGIITLTEAHNFTVGEKVKIIPQDGHLPDSINHEQIYYVIDSSVDNTLLATQIKLAATIDNAFSNLPILPNRKGGKLFVVSRVSDKVPNDPGHPIQWDSVRNNWYINVSTSNNGIYDSIRQSSIPLTGKTYILRTPDNRVEEDKVYKLLYCIPKNSTTSARPPINGFILQESNNTNLSGSEFNLYFSEAPLSSETQLRNPKFISGATWNSSEVTITTEIPHNLKVGDSVEVINVNPSNYNGVYSVIKTPSSRSFVYLLDTNPGIFANDTRERNTNLPHIKKKNTRNIFQIYKSEEVQKYVRTKQDGIYELTIVHSSVKPTISPFTSLSFSQPIKYLYPQLDRDNVNSDPDQTQCFADHNIIGNVFVNDPKNSISKESVVKFSSDVTVGIGITAIVSNLVGTSHTIYTDVDHGLSEIKEASIVSSGSSYIPGTYYGVGVTTTSNGESASFKIVIDGAGILSDFDIMSGGSNYSVGTVLSVVTGIGTTTGFIPATLRVEKVGIDTNKTISLYGFIGDTSGYNETYRINTINNSKTITVSSYYPISGFSTVTVNHNTFGTINGKVLDVSSFVYNNVSGISTIVLTEPHGLKENTKIRLFGFDSSFYNSDVVIKSVNSSTTIEVNSGISTNIPVTTGSRKVIPLGIKPIAGNQRIQYYYSGITTTTGLELRIDDSDVTPININNADFTGLKKGDYFEINGEIMRVKSDITPSSNFVSVYRSQLGTNKKTHPANSVIQKINVIPVELRRNSIIRASGHTFEYVGYGAGNYSTSLPENQDRDIEKTERLISQSTKISGGTVYYTGMDENGDFYSANRKLSSSTGEQEIYDLPVPTVVSESSIDDSVNISDAQKIIASDSIRVDGGENNDIVSSFNGPVIFNEKITSHSDDGIEATSIYLRGSQNVSRKYSISNDTPNIEGNYGDMIFRATPDDGDNLGWVYTTNNTWRTWGVVGETGSQIYIYSGTPSTTDLEGIVDKLKFVGDPTGFGIDVDVEVDGTTGFGTVTFRNPIDIINYGTTELGRNTPRTGTRSQGTRIVFYDSLNSTNADYAVGVSTNILWNSIPQNQSAFFFKWFGGQTEIASLDGQGNLLLQGKISAIGGLEGTLTGNVVGNLTGNASSADQVRTSISPTNLTQTRFIPFVDSNSATATPKTLYTDDGLIYNPNTNILTATATTSNTVNIQSLGLNDNYFIPFVTTNTANPQVLYVNSGLTVGQAILGGGGSGSSGIAITALNLTRSVIAGNGLSGGGQLSGQDVTINVGVGTGIIVNENDIQVDSTVIRTFGNYTIGGVKTFTSNIIGTATTSLEANTVKTTTTSVDAPHFITFVSSNVTSSAGQTLYTDSGITYNPNSNTLSVNISGGSGVSTTSDRIKTQSAPTNATGTRYITFVEDDNTTSTSEILYTNNKLLYDIGRNNLTVNVTGIATTALEANQVNTNSFTSLGSAAPNIPYYLTFVQNDSNGSTQTLYTDSGITYNPRTNTLNTNISGGSGVSTTSQQVFTESIPNTSTGNRWLLFVDSNNNTPTAETLYTNSGLVYNFTNRTLVATATTAIDVNIGDEPTNSTTTQYLAFVSGTGDRQLKVVTTSSGKLSYNPNTNTLNAVVSNATNAENATNSSISDVTIRTRNTELTTNPNTTYFLPLLQSALTSTTGQLVYTKNNLTYNPSTRILNAIVSNASQSDTATDATNLSRSIIAGNGLTGGGQLNGNVTLTLGNPATITGSTSNQVTSTGHSHAVSIDLGSTTSTTAVTITNTAGNNATIPAATTTAAGLITTGTQTIGGDKTFSNNVTISGTLTADISPTSLLVEAKAIGSYILAKYEAPSGTLQNNSTTSGSNLREAGGDGNKLWRNNTTSLLGTWRLMSQACVAQADYGLFQRIA